MVKSEAEDYDIKRISDDRSEGYTKNYLRYWIDSLEFNVLPSRMELEKNKYKFFIRLYEHIYQHLYGPTDLIPMVTLQGFGYKDPKDNFTIEYRPGSRPYLHLHFNENTPEIILMDEVIWKIQEQDRYIDHFNKIKSIRPIPTGVILQLSSFDLTTRIGHPIIEFNAHDLVTQFFANNESKSLHITYPFDQLKGDMQKRDYEEREEKLSDELKKWIYPLDGDIEIEVGKASLKERFPELLEKATIQPFNRKPYTTKKQTLSIYPNGEIFKASLYRNYTFE